MQYALLLMSENSANRTLYIHKDRLNPFALWDNAFLAREARSKAHNITVYETLAKVAWVAFMIFGAIFTMSLGTLNVYSFPAALYALTHLYQPYMEATYHNWKAQAESGRNKQRMYAGILSTYQKLQLLSTTALKSAVEGITKSPIVKNSELYLPLLAQYNYFMEKMTEKNEQLQKLTDEIDYDEVVKQSEDILFQKRKAYYELEESLCIQKVELAYLIHLIYHPFDKNKLPAFGLFEQKEFSHYCSRQLFHPDSSPIFFRSLTKSSLTREQVKNLSPTEIYEKSF